MKNTNMNVYIAAATDFVDKDLEQYENLNERYNYFGGLAAGICYMPNDFQSLKDKPLETTLKRASGTKLGGHHSVFDHCWISLYLENIPKLFAMLLNNEKQYVTSEKSARYTKMQPSEEEIIAYNKWMEILTGKIAAAYGNEPYCDAKRIKKLAQENARYLLSVYTPTNMMYSVSFRQLNYMYGWLKRNPREQKLVQKLEPWIEDFCTALEELHLIDENLTNDQKNRGFSLFTTKTITPYFGDVYATQYEGTFAMLAQAQRHRTIDMSMEYTADDLFYVPKIIRGDRALADMWIEDMLKLKDKIPQGKIITITEKGTPENLILKAKERCCTCAQLEINDTTLQLIKDYAEKTNDPFWAEEMKKYTNGARCTFPDYTCSMPCGFAPGVKMDRDI